MKLQKHHISCWRSQRKPLSWSLICGIMLFALGLISLFTGHVVSDLEYYSQRLIKPHLITKWAASIHEPINIWKSKYMDAYYGCSRRGRHFRSAIPQRFSNGYLLIATSGGLNQQRTGITDAVVVARILNATLVVPSLDHNSYWKDDSDFADIFDVDWFISSLAKDVKIVVQLYKFDYRLANDLDPELQKLRCRVNYHALRFTKPIQELGSKVVLKMREMAKRFIAVHLRFEPDMLAFSGCYYGGGEKEINELREIRKRWDTLPDLSPLEERKRGKCPLTPEEVGVMLRALGYKNDTYLYVASGEIYGGEATLQPLRELFPNFYTKEILAGEELNSLVPFSSRLAAIDYIVCDESDVFVTNNNGNMAKILAGRRRYMGHKRTIKPNAKRLSALFMSRDTMDWRTFAKKVKSAQRGFMGEPDEMKPGRGEFHEFPAACICRRRSRRPTNNTSEELDISESERWRRSNNTAITERLGSSEDDEFLPRL
uniref:O-fucosyltransferase family protein n=1 Tax=Chenopodium quinoa TaxID=63459 RepID=A0A803L5F2_CHEQI